MVADTVLITGGLGFIGARLGQFLLPRGYRVKIASRSTGSENYFPGAERVVTEWDSDAALEEICRGVSVVVHAAGMNAADCLADPIAALSFNGVTTARLVRAACRAGVRRFIYLSTAHVYASPLEGKITEQTCTTNIHPYASSHLAGEQAVLFLTEQEGVEGVVIRLSNAFGVPVVTNTSCWSLFVNDLCRQAATKGSMTIKSNSSAQRDFIALSRVCETTEKLFHTELKPGSNKTFNMGSGQSMTLLEMATFIQDRCEAVLGYRPQIQENARRVAQIHPLVYSTLALAEAATPHTTNQVSEIDSLLLFCKTHFN